MPTSSAPSSKPGTTGEKESAKHKVGESNRKPLNKLSRAQRLALFAEHSGYARRAVGKMVRYWHSSKARDEFITVGLEGLWVAVSRGDTQADNFRWYIHACVVGAIRDELRRQDWFSKNARIEERADPTVAVRRTVSIEAMQLDFEQPSDVVDPLDTRGLTEAIAELPERLRGIVVARDLRGERMIDIAGRMGITEARVSQLRAVALKKLRESPRLTREIFEP